MTQIGKYEIVRRTGQTPLGSVYEAFDPVMHRTVSIQIPGDEELKDGSARRQTSQIALQRGGECLGRLNHPNIRNMLAAEHADGNLYLVLEHVDAQSIPYVTGRAGTTAAEILKLLKMAAAALDYARANGVSHPGLTPEHLLVNEAGLLKVSGFEMCGVQEIPEEQMVEEDITALLISMPYRSPEFLIGEKADSRADQFALGAIAFELLTGQKAFGQESPLEVMSAILSGSSPDYRLLEGRIPPATQRVFERALSTERAARYASCTEMSEALETAILRTPTNGTRMGVNPRTGAPHSTGLNRPATGSGVSRISEQLASARRKSSLRLKVLLTAACLAVGGIVAMILLETRTPVKQNQVNVAPVPAATVAPQSSPSNKDFEDLAHRAEQHAAQATQSPAQGTEAASAKRSSKVGQTNKQKRQKQPTDDMEEVKVGR